MTINISKKVKYTSVVLSVMFIAACSNNDNLTSVNPNTVTGNKIGALDVEPTETVEQATIMAKEILKRNFRTVKIGKDPLERTVIQAGSTHFNALWTRDASYASLGALAAGEYNPVRDTLESVLNYQRDDGLIPRRIGTGNNAWGIIRAALGLESKDNNNYKYVDFDKPSVDPNSLVPWIAELYINKANDKQFLEKYYPRLVKSLDWLKTQENDGLITQKPFSDWKDMTGRGGKVMYSNIMYYQALQSMTKLAHMKNDTVREQSFAIRAGDLGRKINQTFWDDSLGYYKDTDTLELFSPDSNLWAVYFGVTTPAQTQKIFKKADSMLKDRNLLSAADEPYPSSMVPKMLYVFGMQNYADTFSWPWITSLYSMAANKVGDKQRAFTSLNSVARTSLKDGTFYEVYELKENETTLVPVVRKFYTSEKDFSWSAGLYIYAQSQFNNLR